MESSTIDRTDGPQEVNSLSTPLVIVAHYGICSYTPRMRAITSVCVQVAAAEASRWLALKPRAGLADLSYPHAQSLSSS